MQATSCIRGQAVGGRRAASTAAAGRRSVVVRAAAANPYAEELKATAKYIATRGKGILASDESNATTGKRLESVGVENTEDNRRDWRQLLYTAPGLGQYISGAIMFEETLYQKARDGTPFVDVLGSAGIKCGVKVDTGLQVLPGTDGETSTQGLDNLQARCEAYYKQGARFAKWRAVLKISEGSGPSSQAILENAHGLARYAQIAQAAGLVPIVEPEVTLGPGAYSIEETAYWSERVYSHVMRLLNEYDVMLEGILLKPNMCLPGLDAPPASPADVAKYTTRTMLRTIPASVPGIHFLSGGMSEEESTLNLQALQEACPNAPWSLTFSYGRALQASTLKTWAGKEENWDAAQQILVALAKANSEAQLGQFKGPHPVPGGGRILQALRTGGAGK
ncbi:fructose-1,6-bisphosphate aldolase [Chlorella sorokiniana]|uniref:Fructose-bisphosphate aldolase n=1 Tax=Chlorella sorokiniana TaxID=3076 RepID=A0A2P6TYN3_CHLSO|nr:fructose-1,6-bisphosphate aldolase [Chlorella sorokiniana]|eukprot:PRW59176.1 fructose-1,6-bisphosphate aldolase [Chlorella sorokiniana]